MKQSRIFPFIILLFLLLACNLFAAPINANPPAQQLPGSGPRFSPIIFCEDVSDDGRPLNPSENFPAGVTEVWAYFTYAGMQDGLPWARRWEQDGQIYFESTGELWQDGAGGWAAYSISESESIPLNGHYSLKLYIDEELVQQASFEVAPPPDIDRITFPAFGPIQFAGSVTEDAVPSGVAGQFEAGIGEVYAVFPYINMSPGVRWRRQWLLDGQVNAESDVLAWEEGADGVAYASLWDDEGLEPGSYTLNLFIDDQLARSAAFEVLRTVETQPSPARPDEIIDADLIPAWQILYDAQDRFDFLHDIAQFALDHHIEIRMDESYSGEALAYYSYNTYSCSPDYSPGRVNVYRQTWNESSWEKLAGTLAHELTHAWQHYDYADGPECPGCTIYSEYQAHLAQVYTWWMLDRTDLIYDKFPNDDLFDEDGYFDTALLWQAVKRRYADSCPDY